MSRYTVHFAGRVQGVGFRFTAREVAARFDVAGYVQNLPDGRVRVVAEGEPAQLDAFLAQLERRMEGFIEECTIDRGEATGEFGRPGADPLTIRH